MNRYAGRCVRSQSAGAALMRVCQPGTVALKAAITSGDRRMVVACLVGAFCAPRTPARRFISNKSATRAVCNCLTSHISGCRRKSAAAQG